MKEDNEEKFGKLKIAKNFVLSTKMKSLNKFKNKLKRKVLKEGHAWLVHGSKA